jgi:hypothetical protein
VLRNGDNLSIKQVGNVAIANSKELINIRYTNGVYSAKPKDGETFLVIRGLRSGQFSGYPFGYKLYKGAIAQFGYMKLQVRELFDPSLSKGTLDEIKGSGECKICKEQSFNEEDMLIKPCKCFSVDECVHLSCLKKWCQEKVLQQTEHTCVMNELRCASCNARLSIEFCLKFDLLNLNNNSYCIVFKSLNGEEVRQYVAMINKETAVTIVSVYVIVGENGHV